MLSASHSLPHQHSLPQIVDEVAGEAPTDLELIRALDDLCKTLGKPDTADGATIAALARDPANEELLVMVFQIHVRWALAALLLPSSCMCACSMTGP